MKGVNGYIMKRITKIMAALLCVCMAGGALAGCGGADDRTEDGRIKITVGNAPDKNTDTVAYESWQAAADQFMKLNNDVYIEPEAWAYDVQSFVARAEGGTLPTIFKAHFTEGNKIKEFGYSADVTSFMKENGDYDKLNDTMMKNIADEDGNVLLIPESVYTIGVVMNMKLMRQAGLVNEDDSPKIPETFDELAEMAKTVTEKTGAAGFVFPTTGNGGGWLFSNIGWAYGGEFEHKDENGKWIGTLDSDEIVAAMQWLKDMKWKYNCLPANTLLSNADTMKMVGTDQAAMALAHPAQANQLVANYGMSTEDVAMVKIPAGPAERVSLMGGSYYVIANNATEDQIDASLRYLRFKGATTELTDDMRTSIEAETKVNYDQGNALIGIRDLSIWKDTSDVERFKIEMMDKYRNIPENHVASYNDKEGVSYKTEVEVCAQEMYSLLDEVIQLVLNDENSDCKALLTEANNKFQNNFLNNEQ